MSKESARTESEQLEYQRRNPHLFTTLTQSVGVWGEITTYEQVGKNMIETAEKLNKIHVNQFGGKHPLFCLKPMIGEPEHQICAMTEHVQRRLDELKKSFIENFAQTNLTINKE